jgi:hypothetical protein
MRKALRLDGEWQKPDVDRLALGRTVYSRSARRNQHQAKILSEILADAVAPYVPRLFARHAVRLLP